jgi:hypothetical protein
VVLVGGGGRAPHLLWQKEAHDRVEEHAARFGGAEPVRGEGWQRRVAAEQRAWRVLLRQRRLLLLLLLLLLRARSRRGAATATATAATASATARAAVGQKQAPQRALQRVKRLAHGAVKSRRGRPGGRALGRVLLLLLLLLL